MKIYDQLDYILDVLDKSESKKIKVQISESFPNPIKELINFFGSQDVLIEYLDILKEHGYINYSFIENNNHVHQKYHGMISEIKLTIKGRLFVQEGKYLNMNAQKELQNTRLRNIEIRQRQLAEKQNSLTLYLLCVGVIEFGWEIYKFSKQNPYWFQF